VVVEATTTYSAQIARNGRYKPHTVGEDNDKLSGGPDEDVVYAPT
jgi:hypothetical protein